MRMNRCEGRKTGLDLQKDASRLRIKETRCVEKRISRFFDARSPTMGAILAGFHA
jgi:hypothetical protein